MAKRARSLYLKPAPANAGTKHLGKLDAGLAALTRRRPELAATVRTVSDAAAQAVLLQRENARLSGEVAQLTGKTRAQGDATTALIEKQVALATATTPLERARAKLALVQERANAADKAGGAALVAYRNDLTGASQAVNAAEAAERRAHAGRTEHNKGLRDAAKATRDAAKATRDAVAAQNELEQMLGGVLRRFDPLATAAREYAATLADLSKLRGAGKIGIGQDALLTAAAQDQYRKDEQDAAVSSIRRAFEFANPGEDFEKAGIHAAIELRDAMRDGGQEAAASLSSALEDFGSILNDLFPGAGSGTLGRMANAGGRLSDLLGAKGDAIQSRLGGSLEKLAKGVGISDAGALKIGDIGGKAIRGAAEGALADSVFKPLAKGFGMKGSATGAQLGGAVGSLIPALGPFGGMIGGGVGSAIGGMFKTTASGKVTLTNATSDAAATGNNAQAKSAATALGGSVQEGLQQIAAQLSGALGSFNITVGQRHGDYRVTTGSSLKVKNGAKDFNEDGDAANAYAIGLALTQGAVTGLSSAVSKAIGSSTDVNKALKEALAVQSVEDLLGGSLAEYRRAFSEFDTQAKERVRIAREYGFDVLAIEKRNADDRTKLAEQLAAAQTGSLKALVEEMTTGNLFEGTALDKLGVLDTAIAKARTDLDANVAGAGDTLAKLLGEKLATARDAYGSTAGYASIRSTTIGEAQAAISRTNAQIGQATTTSDPALKTTNATLDEIADQTARLIATQQATNELIANLWSGGGARSTFFDIKKMAQV